MAEDALNAEFRRLLKISRWTQSEAARQLHLTDGTISQYLSGQTRPSPTTLKLFRLLMGEGGEPVNAAEVREASAPMEDWERELMGEIRSLEQGTQREFVSHVQALAKLMPKRSGSYRKRKKAS